MPELPRESIASAVAGIATGTLLVLVAVALGRPLWNALVVGAFAAVPTGAATYVLLVVGLGRLRNALAGTGEGRFSAAYQVLIRIPVFDLYRMGKVTFDPEAVTTIRVLAALTIPIWILYGIFPLDLVPDLFPPFTYVDDLVLYPVLREIVYTGHDHEVGVRRATKRMVVHRVALVLVGVLLLGALFFGLLSLGVVSLLHL